MDRPEMERLARRRAGRKMGFIIHATVFLLVNAALYAINQQFTPRVVWSFWPLGGWAIGLAIHGFVVYAFAPGGGLSKLLIVAELRKLG